MQTLEPLTADSSESLAIVPSDKLSLIADTIAEYEHGARTAASDVVHYAILIGKLLTEARELFSSQAEWLVWVADEVGYQKAHAYRLMQLAKNEDKLQPALHSGDLSLRGALGIINESAAEIRKLNWQNRQRSLTVPQAFPESGANWRIEPGDAASLDIPDASVDVIITSPPYGLGIDYADTDDNEGYENYLAEAFGWASEMWRVLRDGGRLLLNVPLDCRRGGAKPMYADWLRMLCSHGFGYATTLIWWDGSVRGSTGRGSVDSPSSPYVAAPVETVICVYKGTWAWGYQPGDFPHADWVKFTGPAGGLWQIQPESSEWHPAVFPRELARRLIGIFSLPGQTVLDPFSGRGTTILEAAIAGRNALGIDKSPMYVELSRQWVSERLP